LELEMTGEVNSMSLAETLDQLTRPGDLAEKLEDNSVRCLACAHSCLIREGKRGICKIRFNREGELQVPWGYVSSIQVDPIEKKPFYHFLAGSEALTFGMLGCNLQCDYCQNWLTSQALREKGTDKLSGMIRRLSSEEIVGYGIQYGAEVVASSYNEPLITSEWAREIFTKAGQAGLKQVYVSNGFATPDVLDYLKPALQGFKVDLKTMQEDHYRDLGGRLQPVLDSIQYAHGLGMWVEIVTLLVPDFNDSSQELVDIARFILSVSPNIPWHISAFRPDYKMMDKPRTSPAQLRKAVEIGFQEGLNYVYAGNMPGSVGEYENTLCHHCRSRLIQRQGYLILSYQITPQGTCPDCGTRIPGHWTENPERLNRSGRGFPQMI
jgi:pyruvate formate lyase activating enzyme